MAVSIAAVATRTWSKLGSIAMSTITATRGPTAAAANATTTSGPEDQPWPRFDRNPLGCCHDRVLQGRPTRATTFRKPVDDDLSHDCVCRLTICPKVRAHHFDADIFFAVVPDVVISNHGEHRVAEPGFAGKPGLRHRRHTDDCGAPRAIEIRLCSRRELRAFDTDVSPFSLHGMARQLRRINQGG